MGKPFTKVVVVGNFKINNGNSLGGLTMFGSAMNKIRLASLQKAGSNWDDAEVMFEFVQYPVYEMNPPVGVDRNVWMFQNIQGMSAWRDSIFAKGVDPTIAKMSENELCELIKKNNGCDNEEAFKIATSIREHKNVPATHILWTWSIKHTPDYIKAFMLMHNSHVGEVVENDEHDTTMVCIDECSKAGYEPKDYLCGCAECRRMDTEGKMKVFS